MLRRNRALEKALMNQNMTPITDTLLAGASARRKD